MAYVAIIGDIVSSRLLENRNEVQMTFMETMNVINKRHADVIAANFLVTLGDEFQGLLTDGEDALSIIHEVEEMMDPVELRFGIGIGGIDTDIQRDKALGADGPAYHHARSAVDTLKKQEKARPRKTGNILIVSTHDSENIRLCNIILDMMKAIESKWTPRQKEVVQTMLAKRSTQTEAAAMLKMKQPNVARSLSESFYETYRNGFDEISRILKEESCSSNT